MSEEVIKKVADLGFWSPFKMALGTGVGAALAAALKKAMSTKGIHEAIEKKTSDLKVAVEDQIKGVREDVAWLDQRIEAGENKRDAAKADNDRRFNSLEGQAMYNSKMLETMLRHQGLEPPTRE